MNRKTINILTGLALGLAFISLTLVPFGLPTQAAPPAAPTPVADVVFGSVRPESIVFQSATAITTDTNSTGVEAMRFGAADVQYIIDHGASTNTLTITVQFSNDNSNWVSGPALVSGSIADGTDITRVPLFGRYTRFNLDVWDGDTDPVTVTLLGVGR